MDTNFQDQPLFLLRVATGLAQGLTLYLLYNAADAQAWPATNGLIFAPLVLVWVYAPLVLSLSLGEMDWRKAAFWTAISLMALAVLGWCGNWQAWPQEYVFGPKPHMVPTILPSAELFMFGGVGLFIAQALIVGGHQDRRFMAHYPTHFDVAWKLAVQLALAALFVGAFWLLLWLGSGLFDLIKLDFFHKLITHAWFSIPVTALVVAGALHLTDIRPVLVRGARTLLLALLSWLLPLIAMIVAGFLASLPFTGLAPLWGFGHASGLLLTAAAALIVLINAAHQDGTAPPPKILRLTGTVAAALPVPLALIAGYALSLRVGQYGWTASRVAVAACVIVALSYAVGYLRAAVVRGPWLREIEQWNFYISLLILAVLAALFTPIASPARIGVADQMARFAAGRVTPAKFDLNYLRRQGGRYGLNALNTLASSGNDQAFRSRAGDVARTEPSFGHAAAAAVMAARITVWPHGQALPAGFLATDWRKQKYWVGPRCMDSNGNSLCDAMFADLDGDGKSEILLFSANDWAIYVFRDLGTRWELVGNMRVPANCPSLSDALRNKKFDLVVPQPDWKQLRIGNTRLTLTTPYNDELTPACPH